MTAIIPEGLLLVANLATAAALRFRASVCAAVPTVVR
jgi:hypothetical protein